MPCDGAPDAEPLPQYLYNFTSWRNAGRGVSCLDNGVVHHIGHAVVENGQDDFTWGLLESPNMTYVSQSLVQDLLAVGSTVPGQLADPSKAGFFGPATEYMLIGPATFINYGGGVLRSCLQCGDELTNTGVRQGCVRGGSERRMRFLCCTCCLCKSLTSELTAACGVVSLNCLLHLFYVAGLSVARVLCRCTGVAVATPSGPSVCDL